MGQQKLWDLVSRAVLLCWATRQRSAGIWVFSAAQSFYGKIN